MIINFLYHIFLVIFVITGKYKISNYLNAIGSLIFSFLIFFNIVNFLRKKRMSWGRGGFYYYEPKIKLNRIMRISILIVSIILELIFILSIFKVINVWPTGLK